MPSYFRFVVALLLFICAAATGVGLTIVFYYYNTATVVIAATFIGVSLLWMGLLLALWATSERTPQTGAKDWKYVRDMIAELQGSIHGKRLLSLHQLPPAMCLAEVFNLQVDTHLWEVSEFRRAVMKSVQCTSGALSESEYVEFVSVSIRPVFTSRMAASTDQAAARLQQELMATILSVVSSLLSIVSVVETLNLSKSRQFLLLAGLLPFWQVLQDILHCSKQAPASIQQLTQSSYTGNSKTEEQDWECWQKTLAAVLQLMLAEESRWERPLTRALRSYGPSRSSAPVSTSAIPLGSSLTSDTGSVPMETGTAKSRWQRAEQQVEYRGAFVDRDSAAPRRPAPTPTNAL